jgi:dipeptidyl aminopeptidase/acylaminoacyl peptidase
MLGPQGNSIRIVTLAALVTAVFSARAGGAGTAPARSGARADTLISLEQLMGPSRYAVPLLSPDGRLLSFMAPVDGALNLWVGPAASPDSARPLTHERGRGLQPWDVSGRVLYRWNASGTHLLYPRDTNGNEQWQLYSLDVRNGQEKSLTSLKSGSVRVIEMSAGHANQALIGINDRDPRRFDPWLLDIETGKLERLEQNDRFAGYYADHELRLRLAIAVDSTGSYEIYRHNHAGAWEKFYEVPMEETAQSRAIGTDGSNREFFAYDSHGRNTAAVIARDLESGRVRVLAEDPKSDVQDVLQHPVTHAVQAYAACFTRLEWHALDSAVAPDLAALAHAGHGDFHVESRAQDDRRWLVKFSRDDGPDTYYLYERPAKRLTRLFSTRPELETGGWARTHPVVIRSRDGFDLVSYYTLPVASDPDGDGRPDAPLPMVMIVHGGPGDERAEFGFFPLIQWLNNRGYAVFNVNFRGSPGFGKKFVNAEQLEWGGRMNDDLVDQARWAAEQGIAKRDGIALLGGSYGGYATLCGLTFSPDVFACGIDVVGPADLETFMSTIPPTWSLDHFAKRVGDPRTAEGRAHLRARSPIHFVDKVTKPILIAQGSNDARVPQAQSDRMAHALDSLGVAVTYLVYPDEGHGFLRAANSRAFYAITDAFLARCLGGRAAPLSDQLDSSSVRVPVGAGRIPGLDAALARRAVTAR